MRACRRAAYLSCGKRHDRCACQHLHVTSSTTADSCLRVRRRRLAPRKQRAGDNALMATAPSAAGAAGRRAARACGRTANRALYLPALSSFAQHARYRARLRARSQTRTTTSLTTTLRTPRTAPPRARTCYPVTCATPPHTRRTLSRYVPQA